MVSTRTVSAYSYGLNLPAALREACHGSMGSFLYFEAIVAIQVTNQFRFAAEVLGLTCLRHIFGRCPPTPLMIAPRDRETINTKAVQTLPVFLPVLDPPYLGE